MRGHIPTEPKPFFWIELTPEQVPRKAKPPSHQHFESISGRMTLFIEVVSEYLYIGSGGLELDEKGRVYHTFTRRNDVLVIPATGIKGAVRSIVEAITNSCVSQKGKSERVPRPFDRCEAKEGSEVNLCPACRLFGTAGYRGRVYFSEGLPLGKLQAKIIKIADLWPPRESRGRKFYYAKNFVELDDLREKNHRFIEAVPRGTLFTTDLFFENVTPAEMGVLIRALGLEFSTKKENLVRAFRIKLGGAKPRCLGAVAFYPKSIRLISSSKEGLFKDLLKGGQDKPVRETLLAWLANEEMLDRQAWDRFHREAQTRREENCPKELY